MLYDRIVILVIHKDKIEYPAFGICYGLCHSHGYYVIAINTSCHAYSLIHSAGSMYVCMYVCILLTTASSMK